MKRKLLSILCICCFTGVVFIGNAFGNLFIDNANNFNKENLLYGNNLINSGNVKNSLNDPCDNTTPPPNGDNAEIVPSCIDTNNDPDPPLQGTAHKGSSPFASSGNYVLKFYKQIPDTENYVHFEERPLDIYDGFDFTFSLPSPYQVNGDYAYYRVDVVDTGNGGSVMTQGYFEVYYPNFEEFPSFP